MSEIADQHIEYRTLKGQVYGLGVLTDCDDGSHAAKRSLILGVPDPGLLPLSRM